MIIFKIILILGCILSELHSQDSSSSSIFTFPKDNKPKSRFRIIGGHVVTPPNLYPFQVALNVRYSSTISLCGGSLISEQWVLTAAHCVDYIPKYVDLIIGAHNLTDTKETTRQTFRSTLIFIHSGWSDLTLQNDIALIKLPENATLNENVGLIRLAIGFNTFAGQSGTILGWGLTETGVSSNPLLQVTVDIMSNGACRAIDRAYDVIQNSHLCTSGAGIRGSCNGDSGGPLVVGNTLVGLVSFGPENCALGFPSVFTRVTSYSDWILETMMIEANATMGSGASARFTTNIFGLSLLTMLICFN